MRYVTQTERPRCRALLAVLSIGLLWLTQPAWAGIETYDPRLDPNYTRATPGNPGLDWRAIEALGREFHERNLTAGSRPIAAGSFPYPQPWSYAGGESPVMAAQSGYGGVGYGMPPMGGAYPSWYGPGVYGWLEPSPRIPWWSLIPPRHHHRSSVHLQFHGRHGRMMGHRGR